MAAAMNNIASGDSPSVVEAEEIGHASFQEDEPLCDGAARIQDVYHEDRTPQVGAQRARQQRDGIRHQDPGRWRIQRHLVL